MTNDKRELLHAQLMEHAGELIDGVITGMAAAGSQGDWDSETIEYVIEPVQRLFEQWGIPLVDDPGAEDVNTKYWCEIGGYDYEGEYADFEPEPKTYDIDAEFVHMKGATVTRGKYVGGRTALIAEAVDEDGFPERETFSVNLVAYDMDPGEGYVFVRDDAEHKGLPDALVTAGIAQYAGTSEDEARVFFGPFNSTAYRMRVSDEVL